MTDTTRAALTFAAYLAVPTLLVLSTPKSLGRTPSRAPLRELAAILLLWLPIEFRLLPPLVVPGTHFDASRFVGLAAAIVLFLVVRPVPDAGFGLRIGRRGVALALIAFVAFSVVAIPIGFATGFIAWQPHPLGTRTATTPLLIYALIALPEEFLFRGLIQNLLARWWGAAPALAVSAIVFGLAHLPDPRYVLLATIAGVAYGWVYQRTRRVTASAITHALVDAVWSLLLRA